MIVFAGLVSTGKKHQLVLSTLWKAGKQCNWWEQQEAGKSQRDQDRIMVKGVGQGHGCQIQVTDLAPWWESNVSCQAVDCGGKMRTFHAGWSSWRKGRINTLPNNSLKRKVGGSPLLHHNLRSKLWKGPSVIKGKAVPLGGKHALLVFILFLWSMQPVHRCHKWKGGQTRNRMGKSRGVFKPKQIAVHGSHRFVRNLLGDFEDPQQSKGSQHTDAKRSPRFQDSPDDFKDASDYHLRKSKGWWVRDKKKRNYEWTALSRQRGKG